MQDPSLKRRRNGFSQDLKKFALRAAQVKGEDLIHDEDFKIFKSLKWNAMDPDFLQSISVLPPTHWWQIKSFCNSIPDILSCISNAKSWKDSHESSLTSLFKLDYFLCMCEASTDEYRFVFLHRFCPLQELKITEPFLRKFACCIRFTEDSLSFDFFDHFHLPQKKEFRKLFIKVLQYFYNSQLKTISIHHLSTESLANVEVMKLIASNSISLITLEFICVHFTYDLEYYECPDIHLPNLERLIFNGNRNISYLDQLSFGRKLTWFEAPFQDFSSNFDDTARCWDPSRPSRDDADIFFEFLATHPNLECFMIEQDIFEDTKEMRSILKSFKLVKKIIICVDENVEHIIGSKIVEHLELSEIEMGNVNWKFITSLEKLKSLIVSGYLEAEPSFFEFLKLDRLEMLSIETDKFEDYDNETLFKTIRLLKNLKVLFLFPKAPLTGVLSDKIESLYISWQLDFNDEIPTNDEILAKFIRGPGVKTLCLDYNRYHSHQDTLPDAYSTFLSTVNLKQYFPKLERVKGEFLTENEEYSLLKEDQPIFRGFVY